MYLPLERPRVFECYVVLDLKKEGGLQRYKRRNQGFLNKFGVL